MSSERSEAILSLSAESDILGDLESALALKEELAAAGHTLSDDFVSRLETMTQSHSQTSECTCPIPIPHTLIPPFQGLKSIIANTEPNNNRGYCN